MSNKRHWCYWKKNYNQIIIIGIVYMVLWWEIIPSGASFKHTKRYKKISICTPVFRSISSDLYNKNTSCYFHEVDSPLFPPYSKCNITHLIHFDSNNINPFKSMVNRYLSIIIIFTFYHPHFYSYHTLSIITILKGPPTLIVSRALYCLFSIKKW